MAIADSGVTTNDKKSLDFLLFVLLERRNPIKNDYVKLFEYFPQIFSYQVTTLYTQIDCHEFVEL